MTCPDITNISCIAGSLLTSFRVVTALNTSLIKLLLLLKPP
jgi:hypothetical protein